MHARDDVDDTVCLPDEVAVGVAVRVEVGIDLVTVHVIYTIT